MQIWGASRWEPASGGARWAAPRPTFPSARAENEAHFLILSLFFVPNSLFRWFSFPTTWALLGGKIRGPCTTIIPKYVLHAWTRPMHVDRAAGTRARPRAAVKWRPSSARSASCAMQMRSGPLRCVPARSTYWGDGPATSMDCIRPTGSVSPVGHDVAWLADCRGRPCPLLLQARHLSLDLSLEIADVSDPFNYEIRDGVFERTKFPCEPVS